MRQDTFFIHKVFGVKTRTSPPSPSTSALSGVVSSTRRMVENGPHSPDSVGLAEHGMLLSLQSATQPASCLPRKVAVKGPRYAITPADTRTSPVRFTYLTPNRSADSSHRAFSPPKPSISYSVFGVVDEQGGRDGVSRGGGCCGL